MNRFQQMSAIQSRLNELEQEIKQKRDELEGLLATWQAELAVLKAMVDRNEEGHS